ncbi:uncharacterized protein LOC120655251 [Panicum virgatum]|uniref:uncharacterized protein LOC120655251 n=1 Tax=Panicum virgatum TaxID=38727 RepID=UPI0019D5BAAB|nr:uncharacterized protein LOC120655251 [Panicum virgatum]
MLSSPAIVRYMLQCWFGLPRKRFCGRGLGYERMNWFGTHHDSEVVGQEKGLGKSYWRLENMLLDIWYQHIREASKMLQGYKRCLQSKMLRTTRCCRGTRDHKDQQQRLIHHSPPKSCASSCGKIGPSQSWSKAQGT